MEVTLISTKYSLTFVGISHGHIFSYRRKLQVRKNSFWLLRKWRRFLEKFTATIAFLTVKEIFTIGYCRQLNFRRDISSFLQHRNRLCRNKDPNSIQFLSSNLCGNQLELKGVYVCVSTYILRVNRSGILRNFWLLSLVVSLWIEETQTTRQDLKMFTDKPSGMAWKYFYIYSFDWLCRHRQSQETSVFLTFIWRWKRIVQIISPLQKHLWLDFDAWRSGGGHEGTIIVLNKFLTYQDTLNTLIKCWKDFRNFGIHQLS